MKERTHEKMACRYNRMKTITLDFETYEEELKISRNKGFTSGVFRVYQYLESGKRFVEFVKSSVATYEQVDYWEDVLKLLNRYGEWFEYVDAMITKPI